jgi:MSHA type pilus biogenesis protein MshL
VLNGLTVSEALRFLLQDTGLHLVEEDTLDVPTYGVLDSVSVPQAIEILARRHDFDYQVEGSQLVVRRLLTRTFPVNQIAIPDSPLWAELQQNLQGLLSPEGRLVMNTRTGTATVMDRPSALRRVERFLEELEEDYARQVDIEARILEIRLKEGMEVGVDWTALAHGWEGFQGNTPEGGLLEQRTVTGSGVFRLGLIRTDRADLLVDALATEGRLNVISRPRVTTMGNETAVFRATENVPYFVVDVIPTQGTTPYVQYELEFREAGVTLEVLAHIGDDGQITLQVHPVVSEVTGFTENLPNLPPQPIIDQRETRTTVRMRDGQTLVIGGLILERKNREVRGVPVLSKIPLLGWFFRNTKTSTEKVELVVMLTPRVLRDEVRETIQEGDQVLWIPTPWPGQGFRSRLAAYEHNLAVEAFRRGDVAEAVRRARRAVAADPSARAARLNLAVFLAHRGHLREARRVLRELSRDPGWEPLARIDLAALQLLTRSPEGPPPLPEARGIPPLAQVASRLNRALSLAALGDGARARKLLEEGFAALPPWEVSPRVLIAREIARLAREEGEEDEARAWESKAARLLDGGWVEEMSQFWAP